MTTSSLCIWKPGFLFLPLHDFFYAKSRVRALLCVRLPSCSRIEKVHSGTAHARVIDAVQIQGGGWTRKTNLTVSSPVSYWWTSSKGKHSVVNCATAVEAMAVRYALLFFIFLLVALICKMFIILYITTCTLLKFIHLFVVTWGSCSSQYFFVD